MYLYTTCLQAPDKKYFKRGDLAAKQAKEYWAKHSRVQQDAEEKETQVMHGDKMQVMHGDKMQVMHGDKMQVMHGDKTQVMHGDKMQVMHGDAGNAW
jgi:hypothetical protein